MDNLISMSQFIRENRTEIDDAIKSVSRFSIEDDDERENWIINDEGLYNWAISCNVDV